MKKKVLAGVGVLVAVGVIGSSIYFGFFAKKPPQKPGNEAAPKTSGQQLLTWDDPAGFTFDYPDGLTVDKHDEDQKNYAHIEFTSKDHPGSVIVWAKDTTAADTAAWVKAEAQFKGANVLETTLAGLPARKILLTTPTKMLIVGTVSDNIVFSVVSTLADETFWSGVQTKMTDSFAFKPATGNSSGGVSDEQPVDEEETIQ